MMLRWVMSVVAAIALAGTGDGAAQTAKPGQTPARALAASLGAQPVAARQTSAGLTADGRPRRPLRLDFGVDPATETTSQSVPLAAGTYACFVTAQGDFVARLMPEAAPKTVANFVGLANATKEWKHPVTLNTSKRPIYNSTLFYKIVEDSFIYGGDPINTGSGDSGYSLQPELKSDVTFDRPWLLAMDQSGDKASGSRWIVTLRAMTLPVTLTGAPANPKDVSNWSGKYTIFGRIVAGYDVVRAISRRPVKRPTQPLDPTLLDTIRIVDVPAGKLGSVMYRDQDGRRVAVFSKTLTDAPTPTPTPKPRMDDAKTSGAKSAADKGTTGTAAKGKATPPESKTDAAVKIDSPAAR